MIIYGLRDPRTAEIRYIGQTIKSAEHRLKVHLKPHELKKRTHKNNWLNELLAFGFTPEIIEIMRVDTVEELDAAEVACIDFGKAIGLQLTNGTAGGEGAKGAVRSAETREKVRRANLGKKASPEAKAKMSAAHVGRVVSEETRKKLSLALAGKSKATTAKSVAAHQRLRKQIKCSDGRVFTGLDSAAQSLQVSKSVVFHHLCREPGNETVRGLVLSYVGGCGYTPQRTRWVKIYCADGRTFENAKEAALAFSCTTRTIYQQLGPQPLLNSKVPAVSRLPFPDATIFRPSRR